MTTHQRNTPTTWAALPTVVATYLTAHDAGENANVLDTFTPEFIGATTIDVEHVGVLQRLEGNFPGGVADLHYRFTLDGAMINRLVIEP